MWGSFKSYFGQYPNQETTSDQSDCDEIEKSFVFIDKEGNEIERTNEPLEISNLHFDGRLNPLPLLDISNTSSTQSSPQLSPTKIEEGWFVAPPPCFTMNSTGVIEKSPLEDLLIEHPSMSVYSQVPCLQLVHKKAEDNSQASAALEVNDKSAKRTNGAGAKSSFSAACIKPKDKNNKTQLDLKNLVDQVENTKPAHHAKWENDQYKLCPSYINRQNRVHRYQSRKHHNQKKKSISKPFAEKGKHGF